MATRYTFSGHESFCCKSLWLKKGYDAVSAGLDFNSPDAVARLGVGKNMVSAIRYWMRAFGLLDGGTLTPFARYIFSPEDGRDPYLEDEGSLFLLHYHLVATGLASLYRLVFLEFRREKLEFDRDTLLAFVRRKCGVPEQRNVFNENTVTKDIRVFLQTYVMPQDIRSVEDFSALLLDLGLVRRLPDDRYAFSELPGGSVDPRLLLYALLDCRGGDATVSFDTMQDLCLVFGLTVTDFITAVREMESLCPGRVLYTDNSGIKNIQFIGDIDAFGVLDSYYADR